MQFLCRVVSYETFCCNKFSVMIKSERVLLQTRLPLAFRIYLKAYAKQHQVTLETACQEILEAFLDCQPWQKGFEFQTPLSNRSDHGEQQGWRQFNVLLSPELAARIYSLSDENAVSRATITFSGLAWFIQYISPA